MILQKQIHQTKLKWKYKKKTKKRNPNYTPYIKGS